MRIVLLIDHLGCGGAQRQLCMLGLLLKRRGFDVSVVTYHAAHSFFGDTLREARIPVLAVSPKTRWGRIAAVRRQLQVPRPEVVMAFLGTPNLLAELSGLPSRKYRLIVSERSFDVDGPSWKSFARFQFHRLADAIVTNSHAQRSFIRRHAPHLAGKTRAITNCVDLDYFAPAPASQKAATDDRLLVLGNFAWYKNPLRFGVAVQKLFCELPQARLAVHWYGNRFFAAGRPTAASLPYLQLERLIAEYGLQDRFFVSNPTPDVLEKYRWATAVCVPSIIEGFPNVLGEAMACGLPVLASRTGDNERLVTEGENGYLFDARSTSDMTRALRRFVEQPPDVKQRLGEAGRRKALSLLSPETFIDQYVDLINAVCRARNAVKSAA